MELNIKTVAIAFIVIGAILFVAEFIKVLMYYWSEANDHKDK